MGSMKELLTKYEKQLIEIFQEKLGTEEQTFSIKVRYALIKQVELQYIHRNEQRFYSKHTKEWMMKLCTYVKLLEPNNNSPYGGFYDNEYPEISSLPPRFAEIICNHGDTILKKLPKAIDKKLKKEEREQRERDKRDQRVKEKQMQCKAKLQKIVGDVDEGD
jgi:hypothetical protein